MGSSDNKARNILLKQKKIAVQLLNSFDVSPGKTHVGVIIRSSPSIIGLELGEFKERHRLYKQIDRIQITENGDLSGALAIASNGIFSPAYGARPDFGKSLVVFIDGYLHSDRAALRSVGEKMKRKGIRMIVIDVSSDIKPTSPDERTPFYDVFFFPPLLDELEIALYPVLKAMEPGQTFLPFTWFCLLQFWVFFYTPTLHVEGMI